MTFEEDFPSLTGKNHNPAKQEKFSSWFFLAKDLQEYCLDKQRVKEAIIFHRNQEGFLQAQDLMDYLGLE